MTTADRENQASGTNVSTESFLDVVDLKKIHQRGETEVPALRGVTCSFAKGTFNFILGPSGSGKITLLYLMGALDDPSSGEVIFLGNSLREFSERERDD